MKNKTLIVILTAVISDLCLYYLSFTFISRGIEKDAEDFASTKHKGLPEKVKAKKKEKDGTDVIGNIIKCKTAKSRLSKENQQVEVRLYYDERGLDKYYGLLELGELGGIWKNVAGRYEIDGKKIYAKEILKNPEKYFTEEVMQQLDAAAKQNFSYGTT
jgi:hypothetical protein